VIRKFFSNLFSIQDMLASTRRVFYTGMVTNTSTPGL
jgi:hypothetical protein